MPELPDLQVFSANLHKRLRGKEVAALSLSGKGASQSSHIGAAVKGQKIKAVRRDGKELRLDFRNHKVLGIHLMLHGSLRLLDGTDRPDHVIMDMRFTDDTALVLTDWQRAATVTLDPEEKDAPDAMDKKVNATFLSSVMAKKRTAVKTMLMDQKIIRGIGNAYADEILWEARISPFSICNKVPADAGKALAAAIKSVLTHAEKQIQAHDPETISGEYRSFLAVHNAARKKSPSGGDIHHKMISGRKTYFTDEQELFE